MAKREIRICLQLLKPDNKDLFSTSVNFGPVDQIICVDELKLYLLAKTSICPGINTIVATLITSNKPSIQGNVTSWVYDYLNGLQNEIYRIPFEGDKYAGLSFSTVATQIYKEFNLILIALEVSVGGSVKVFLNPSDYIF